MLLICRLLHILMFTNFQCDFRWGWVWFPRVRQQDVSRFQISVHNPFWVQSFHCTRYKQTDTKTCIRGINGTKLAHRLYIKKETNILHIKNLSSFNYSIQPPPQPFTTLFWDHPGEPVPEENFWTFWCKGRLTAADTQTIQLGATSSGLTSAHLHHPPIFLQAGCPSCRPTNSVKALKATSAYSDIQVVPLYEYCTCCQC